MDNVLTLDEHRAPSLPDRFGLVRLPQLSEPTSAPYVIKGLIEQRTVASFYGESSAGKSWLVAHAAACIATGSEFFGRRVESGLVVIAALEGREGFKRRLIALQREARLSASDPLVMLTRPFDLHKDDSDARALVDLVSGLAVEVAREPRLVVIDTAAQVMGSADDNSREVAAIYERCASIADATGACVALIDHEGKDGARGQVGSFQKKASVDTQVRVTRGTTNEDPRTWKITKAKDSPNEGDSKSFTLRSVEIGQDQDGETIWSAVIDEVDGLAKVVRDQLPEKQALVLTELGNVLAEKSRPVPKGKGFPTSTTHGVQLSELLERLVRVNVVDGDKTVGRQGDSIRSTLMGLQKRRLISQLDDWIWRV